MISTLFLDFDNTLVDFNAGSRLAMKNHFPAYGLTFEEWMFDTFLTVNNRLWGQLEKGEITREKLREIRWNTVFKEIGVEADGPKFEIDFENATAETAIPIEGAEELLTYLAAKYTLCLVTNGFTAVQHNRLKISGFGRFFKHIFTSQEIGVQKPAAGFFDKCFDVLPDVKKEEVILVGDSLTADIKGGIDYGLKTVWYNRYGAESPKDYTPTYTVSTLEKIKEIL